MTFRKKKSLYLITDRAIARLPNIEIASRAISAGVRVIQLREKLLSKREIISEAAAIRKMASSVRAVFILNDYVDIALAVDADGVHLGQDDLPVSEARKILGRRRIIGISTHNLRQALRAQEEGADYIGFGPLFSTLTKDAGRPKGLDALRRIKRRVRIPVVAIGGITCENVRKTLDAGADACAIASAVLRGDIARNVSNLFSLLGKSKRLSAKTRIEIPDKPE